MAKRNSIRGAWAWRLIEMLQSPPNRVLSLSAKLVLERLEIELYQHGGKPEENGKLPCTYEHFVEFGLHRHAIAPAIRELAALGFVEITRRGCAGNAGLRQPALYRLTYRHSGSLREPTNEWRRIKTLEEASAVAKRARAQPSGRRPKTKSQCRRSSLGPVMEAAPIGTGSQCRKQALRPAAETITTSISRVGTTRSDAECPPSLALTPIADALPPVAAHPLAKPNRPSRRAAACGVTADGEIVTAASFADIENEGTRG